jgi:lysophospholipase L1-like esterase
MQLGKAVETLRTTIPNVKIIIATTIAPNGSIFGDGVLGYSLEEKSRKVQNIKQYLESTINFANGEHIPLANAYYASLLSNNEGNPLYINAGDHIHPSNEGRTLFSQTVARTIINANYLE